MHTFIQESCSVVFKDFRISTAPCVINYHLEHSFYIDINTNTISYFNTVKMLFVILLSQSLVKKMKYHSFLVHFGKRTDVKWWLGVGLGRCDRQTVVATGVNLSWLRHFLCNRRSMSITIKCQSPQLRRNCINENAVKMKISKENKSHQLSKW